MFFQERKKYKIKMTDKRYETKQKNRKCTKRERVKYKKYTKIKNDLWNNKQTTQKQQFF